MADNEPYAENLCLFVSDALRYDYGRHYLLEEYDLPGTFVKGIAQGPGTPSSFPTIVSGVGPDVHDITMFEDHGITEPTLFDLDEQGYDTGYFDHPNDPVNRLLGNPTNAELDELDAPFVYIEREVATHTPYGTNWHRELEKGQKVTITKRGDPREYPDFEGYAREDWDNGSQYIDLMMEGKVDFETAYREGIELSIDRFCDHIEHLESRGLLEDTFVVFTADHGEVWGHHDGRPTKWIHNCICPEVINVPVLFYDRDVDVEEPVALKDLARIWQPAWDDIREDLEADHGPVAYDPAVEGTDEAVQQRLRELGYVE